MTISHLSIHIRGSYKSIQNLQWPDIPPFAVVTGPNGVGKTQLLEAIALGTDTPLTDDRGSRERGSSEAKSSTDLVIKGADVSAGDAVHVRHFGLRVQTGYGGRDDIVRFVSRIREELSHPQAAGPIHKEIARRLKCGISDLPRHSPEQIFEQCEPSWIAGWRYPPEQMNLGALFYTYAELRQYAARNLKWSEDRINHRWGQPPWTVLDGILATAGFPFRVVPPPEPPAFTPFTQPSYHFELQDRQTGGRVALDELSSGEKVLISMLFFHYNVDSGSTAPKLLLLDEPDAHLHPVFTHRMLDVLRDVVVARWGSRVILTTHSPSTVALAPERSVFVLRRDPLRIEPISGSEAVAELSEGFVTVGPSMQTVYVEGPTDRPFYELVWDLLTRTATLGDNAQLSRTPGIRFVHLSGDKNIPLLVRQLRGDHGLTDHHAILDRDNGREPTDGIHVPERRTLENYLFDPLIVWMRMYQWWSDGYDREEVDTPSVEEALGVDIAPKLEARIRDQGREFLQRAADHVVGAAEAEFGAGGCAQVKAITVAEQERVPVRFEGGIELLYPRWCLRRGKGELQRIYQRTCPKLKPTDDVLRSLYRTLGLVSKDIADILRAIQNSARPG